VASAVPEAMQSVEAAASAVPEAMQSVEAAASAVPEAMQPMRAEVSRVLASTDPADLAKLYSEGGMDRLANLQKAGALSTDEAKILNARLAQRVNQNIDNAMRDTIDQFEGQTGVRVKSSVLGDSGSSARPGGNPKIKTDFDVTHSTNFDKADLRHYAAKRSLETGKPMNFAQADAELQELYGKQLEANVDKRLIADKFSGGVKDVDFKRYDGIGKSAGQADAYPPGYTGSRQAVQGRGKIFEVGEDGAISSHNISGQAVVDQHGLNQLAVTGELPPNSTRFGADEFKDFSAQQVKSVTEHSDVKSLAKAMGRESDLAARVDSMAGNQVQARQLANAKLPTTPPQLNKDLVKLSKQLELFPSETEKILAAHGLDEASFADAVRGHIFRYHAAIGGSLVF
jgi:hypothetical protein